MSNCPRACIAISNVVCSVEYCLILCFAVDDHAVCGDIDAWICPEDVPVHLERLHLEELEVAVRTRSIVDGVVADAYLYLPRRTFLGNVLVIVEELNLVGKVVAVDDVVVESDLLVSMKNR